MRDYFTMQTFECRIHQETVWLIWKGFQNCYFLKNSRETYINVAFISLQVKPLTFLWRISRSFKEKPMTVAKLHYLLTNMRVLGDFLLLTLSVQHSIQCVQFMLLARFLHFKRRNYKQKVTKVFWPYSFASVSEVISLL